MAMSESSETAVDDGKNDSDTQTRYDWGKVHVDSSDSSGRTDPYIELDQFLGADAKSATAPIEAPEPAGSGISAERHVDGESPPRGQYRDLEKIGIIGGKGVGKSYLFQSIVYRLQNAGLSGALAYFIENDSIDLTTTLRRDRKAIEVNPASFNRDYENWTRLPTTLAENQPWYHLRLPFRTGFLGMKRSAMEIEFFDGSGEQFFESRDPGNKDLWDSAYGSARVMTFCLPLWAAFPRAGLSPSDLLGRQEILESFYDVVQNYESLRTASDRRQPVRAILALTMADDRRGALDAVREKWIAGYLERPTAFLQATRTGQGIARYLANARRVSKILRDEFKHSPFPIVANIPKRLSFGGGHPWLLPVSAIDGQVLDRMSREYPNPDDRVGVRSAPVPVHVELPLLIALCDRDNALM